MTTKPITPEEAERAYNAHVDECGGYPHLTQAFFYANVADAPLDDAAFLDLDDEVFDLIPEDQYDQFSKFLGGACEDAAVLAVLTEWDEYMNWCANAGLDPDCPHTELAYDRFLADQFTEPDPDAR